MLIAVIGSFTLAAEAQTKQKKSLVDPRALRILKTATDQLGRAERLSYRVVNVREDLTSSGHRVDREAVSQVVLIRPNKVKVVRQGHLVDQEVYYNGRTLTVVSPAKKIYSAVDVPGTIDETLMFARQKLGIGYPAADLMYTNAYDLMTKNVRTALVLGKEMVAGVRCDHLLFTLKGVDFQIWVPDHGDPFPAKYIVTDTATPKLLSVVATFSDWQTSPAVKDSDLEFVPAAGYRQLPFLTADGRTLLPKKP